MRILNVGDFEWMTGRERDTANVELFAIRRKLSNAAVRAGHLVVELSDRAVARARAPFRLRGLRRRTANRAFLQFVDEVRPDLILLNFADEVTNGALAEARALSPGVLIAEINIDPLPDTKNRARLIGRTEEVDAIFVTTAGEALKPFAGVRTFVAYMPNPVDRSVETARAFEGEGFVADLILPAKDDSPRPIGAAFIRPTELCKSVASAAPGLRLRHPGVGGEPRLRGAAYMDALASSRMGLSLSRRNDQFLYASDRMAHMLGSGLLTFVDERAGFDRFYRPDEIALYEGRETLIASIRRFSADDAARRETARRGWERTWRLFDGARVFAYLVDQLGGSSRARDYGWPADRWRA